MRLQPRVGGFMEYDFSNTIAILGVTVTAVATLFAFLAFIEWQYLKKFRKELEEKLQESKEEITKNFNATHKVIASYVVQDADSRISLLKTALNISPKVYNGYNTLGYAYIEKKQYDAAIEAFTKACVYFPEDPAGYCDLAYVYLLNQNKEACKSNLQKAVSIDRKQEEIIKNDPRFLGILE